MEEIRFAYPCILRKDTEGRFVVRFQNIPEALTDGATKEEALAEAVDCLSTALVGYMLQERPLPVPSPHNGRSYLIAPNATSRLKAAVYTVARDLGVTAAKLAHALGIDHKEARRILDPNHRTKADRLEAALAAMGYATELSFYAAAENRRVLRAPGYVESDMKKPARESSSRTLA
jgi:antitoxin HicB